MKKNKNLIRFGMAAMICLVSIPLLGLPAQAEDAAAFFRKDKNLWSRQAGIGSPVVGNPAQRQKAGRAGRTSKIKLRGSKSRFASAARRAGVPVRIALAVIAVESRGNCRAVGRRGELGPLQIKPRTARGLGYRGSNAALRSCGAGLYWGMKHLAISYRKCGSAVLHNKGLAGSCRATGYSRKVMQLASRV